VDQHLKKRGGSQKTVRTPENIERVREAFERSPHRSDVRHATTLGITLRSVRRILHNHLHYHLYKIQIVQALNTRDYWARVCFCQEMLDLISEDEDLVNSIWMSDEARFHVSGFVNKQNFSYWSQALSTSRKASPFPKSDSMVRYVSIGNHRALLF